MANAQTSAPSVDSCQFAADSDSFASDLYSRLAGKEGNLCFSPYSIDSALAMTYAGARGETAAQMKRALRFSLPDGVLHPAAAELRQSLNDAGTKDGKLLYQLDVANRLWGLRRYPYRPEFLTLLNSNYGAGLEQVDFAQSEPVRQQINGWVEKQTRDKIKDLIAKGMISGRTRLVLVNAIYFKAAWDEPFNKKATTQEPFHVDAKQAPTVSMMHRHAGMAYMENGDLQAVELPYKGWRLSMVVLLPRKVDGLSALEKKLGANSLADWIKRLGHEQVQLSLPKFKVTGQFELSDELKGMGMADAFSDRADFSGMTSDPAGLAISNVVHKAFVDVNEDGTEAAAATAVLMRVGAAYRPQEPAVFKADHPFIFLIRDRESGAILFIGRVVDPKTSQQT